MELSHMNLAPFQIWKALPKIWSSPWQKLEKNFQPKDLLKKMKISQIPHQNQHRIKDRGGKSGNITPNHQSHRTASTRSGGLKRSAFETSNPINGDRRTPS